MKPAARSALRRVRRVLLDNLAWKLLSVIIAVVIWALVASEPEVSSFETVRLEYRNLPDDLEISSEPIGTVALELRGTTGTLDDETFRPAAVIDMSGVRPGERTFAIGAAQVKLPRSVKLIRAIPAEVRFRFDRRIARDVNVVPQFAGEGQNGYRVAQWQVQPPRVTIVGPAANVGRVQFVVTDPVDVTNVVGSAEFRVNAFVSDPNIRFQTSPQVTVVVTMKKF